MSERLANLLTRIQGKIESRTRRPWFDLQRAYYYKDSKAVNNIAELKLALEHFHVLISESDYVLLWNSFPNTNGCFDFRTFTERLYPREAPIGRIVDGRVETTPSPGSMSTPVQAQGQSQSRPLQTAQSLPVFTSTVPSAQVQPYNPSYATASLSPSKATQRYEQPPAMSQTMSLIPTEPYAPYQPPYVRPAFSNTTGAIPIYSDVTDPVTNPLNQTFTQNGVTYWYRDTNPKKVASVGPGAPFFNPIGSIIRRGPSQTFRSRITYNRQSQQRWCEVPFESSFPQPRPTPYPHQELQGKPRFGIKQRVELVEVPRRHNISRQYNREGRSPSQTRF